MLAPPILTIDPGIESRHLNDEKCCQKRMKVGDLSRKWENCVHLQKRVAF